MDKKKILVADDEPNIRLLVSSMLSQDYIVIAASDGEEAIALARRQKPDLILMDIMMPKMDGYAACSVLKADPATRAIPVVMLTGVAHKLNKRLAKEVDADGYITKPFGREELLNTIAKLLETS
jgi:CheY-like chemotaxis protein